MKVFKAFAKKGIPIKKIYAVSDTADGVKVSRELGFEESPPAPNSTFGQYILDVKTSISPFAREYQELLERRTQQANTRQEDKGVSPTPATYETIR